MLWPEDVVYRTGGRDSMILAFDVSSAASELGLCLVNRVLLRVPTSHVKIGKSLHDENTSLFRFSL